MLKGISVQELASKLIEIQDNKTDLIAPIDKIKMDHEGYLNIEGHIAKPNKWSGNQISTYTGIPNKYYERLLSEDAGLLSLNVNHGFSMAAQQALLKRKKESRMIRIYNGNLRAFLSSKYRRLDCSDLMATVLPILQEGNFNVVSSQLTEQKMYIKVTTDRIQGEVKKGMIVQYGLVISSSDVGAGSLRVEPLLYECVCDNGMILNTSMRKYHVGKDREENDVQELLSDATAKVSDEAFWMTVSDVVRGSMKAERFEEGINKLKEASEIKITNYDLGEVVDLTMKEIGVSGENKKKSILEYLASGADNRGLTKYGLANAFTYAAHSAEDIDYEDATELERAGGKIIELPKTVWRKVAEV